MHARPTPAGTRPAITVHTIIASAIVRAADTITARKPALAGPHGLVAAAGGGRRCRGPGFAIVLWRRGPPSAAARFNAIIAAGKSAVTAQPAPSTVQVAATEAAPPQVAPPQATPQRRRRCLAQAATARRRDRRRLHAPPDQTQLLQTIARDLANLERTIEQLKANQQQTASDNSKAIGELKATQEEMKRALAKVSEPAPPRRQLVAASDAAGPGLAQARAKGRAAAGENAAAILPEGMDLRRLVAAEAVIVAIHVRHQLIERVCIAQRRVIATASSHRSCARSFVARLPSHPTCQFREAGAACSHG